MKNMRAKLAARRAARDVTRRQPVPTLVKAEGEGHSVGAPAVCELCESDWGTLTVEEIAELLLASGRFPEEEREALVALPRELLVSVFCGCAPRLRLAPPLASSLPSSRRAAP